MTTAVKVSLELGMNPEDFLQNELQEVYPCFSILAKLPLELTAPFYPTIVQKWRDRNMRTLSDLIKSSSVWAGEMGATSHAEQETLSDEQHIEIENWLRALNDAFIELAALRIRERYKSNDTAQPE